MILDDYEYNHLWCWLNNQYFKESEKEEVYEKILDFLEEYPDLLNNRSWNEIRDMAIS